MENSIHEQVYIFFTTFYGGIIIGFIYDLYRIFRYYSKPKKIATFIEDLVFWIIVSFIALFILIFSNWGEIRGYVFLGFVSGAIVYNKLLSKIVIKILVYIVKAIIKFLKILLDILLWPIKILANLLYRPYKKVSSEVKKIIRKVKRILKLPARIVKDIKKYTKFILQKK
ncbi:spore cortex biosynthesis protein YabQ [Caldisalinibacter kiritimatiensis]|uniref:Spore cortex biosynthesis protein n=1 Tax=Caldisalinibacter kiritimatiensis TaxID=1304284 RepID=R1AVC1_9FIRM|nr:spore cortex biosynthesis protein YabQ [Caldisalinibacter kiritimatiensis]EOD01153.1 Spore cortex biosynthesis protein [Caldisalinibacter kiritimatiensis]